MEIFGYLGTVIGIFAMFPQIVKSIKTKSMNDFSIYTSILIFSSSLSWLIYIILTSTSIPLILSTSFNMLVSSLMLYLKIRYINK